MLELIRDSILLPLVLGLVIALAGPRLGRMQALALGVAVLASYVMLEGVPAFPPAAGKQKLAYLLALAILAAHLPRPRLVLPLFLAGAALWLGWPKLMGAGFAPQMLLVLAPAAVAALGPPVKAAQPGRAFLWPVVLTVYAAGTAALSVIGVFMGFAQVMGALAALVGIVAGVGYVLALLRGPAPLLSAASERLLLLAIVASGLMVALFAPDASLLAHAVLSLALVVPLVARPLDGVTAPLRPFAYAALSIIPAVIAVIVALNAVQATV